MIAEERTTIMQARGVSKIYRVRTRDGMRDLVGVHGVKLSCTVARPSVWSASPAVASRRWTGCCSI